MSGTKAKELPNDIWYQLMPYVDIKDLLAWMQITRTYARLLKCPASIPNPPTTLNWFWRLLLKFRWKTLLEENYIERCRTGYHWTEAEYQLVYNELYRLFFVEFPDGPGVAAVESEEKRPLVSMVPLYYVPQPPASTEPYPSTEPLSVYTMFAKLFQTYPDQHTTFQSKGSVKTDTHWSRLIPRGFLYDVYVGQLQYRVSVNFGVLYLPTQTNYDRFNFTRFLLSRLGAPSITTTMHMDFHARAVPGRIETDLHRRKKQFYAFNLTVRGGYDNVYVNVTRK